MVSPVDVVKVPHSVMCSAFLQIVMVIVSVEVVVGRLATIVRFSLE